MAELFMECEEEELEPWQQKANPIVVDDDDDDDEPIFVGEFLSSKPTNTYILNRVNPNSSRIGMQNGAPKRGAVAVSPGFHSSGRPATSTLAVQPQPRVSSILGSCQVLQKPLSGCSSPQEGAKSSTGISQPINISAPPQSLSRNLHIPASAQPTSRPVATVTAQPVALNRVTPDRTLGLTFGIRQNSGGSQYQSGSPMNTAGLSKRPSTSEASNITPKKAKSNETGSESESPLLSSIKPPDDLVLLEKDVASSNIKNGAPFPQACPKCNIHFNLLEPLKNHIKYCCPDMVHTFPGITKMDCSGISPTTAESEKGKLIMLVNDFYYGKHEGNLQQVRQEQKTHTTFKCASCMKVLKSNIRFMNHMKHHLELEKQNSESWESHTTCQHCYRQFPTPFQLQCHIESTHTPHESSTICKICELSFETEQVLLQHMKDNHKPGEMPYVCQVCNYRSSAFSDVEKHFRSIHENTKNLLCPFCLKVIKIGAPYMHHFMRHQKKGIHRCTKCRLQFLTCKEKLDHKSQHHRTFKKPVQLEGLPPGTKVTIRASSGSLQPASVTASPVSTNTSTLLLSPGTKAANSKAQNKPTASCKGKAKLKLLSMQKKLLPGTDSSGGSKNHSSSGSSSGSSGAGSGGSKKTNKVANTALNNLRCPDIQKCIECYSDIRTFASHFPTYVRCGLCRYGTSCSKAYVNHMMGFHSARQTKRFWIYKTHSDELRGTTVVCLNCDFLTDVSGLDKMATHLNESQTHTCQVIVEHVPVDCFTTADVSGLAKDALLNNEMEEKSEKHLVPTVCEEKGEACISESLQMKGSVRETNADLPGKLNIDAALAADSEGTQRPVPENRFSSEFEACSRSPARRGALGGLGNQQEESLPLAGGEGKSSLEEDDPVSSPEPEACTGESSTTSPGKLMDEYLSDAQKEGPVLLSAAATSKLYSCSKDSSIKGSTHSENPSLAVAESKASLPVTEGACASELIGSPSVVGLAEDCGPPNQNDLGPLAAEHDGSTAAAESSSGLELLADSSDTTVPEAARDADALRNKSDVGLLICRRERTEDTFALGESAHSDGSADLAGEGGENRTEDGDKAMSLTAQCEGSISELVGDESSIAEFCTFSKNSPTGMVRDPLGNPAADEHEGSPSLSAVKNGTTPGLQENLLESSCEKAVFDKQGEAEPTELGSNKSSACSKWTGSDVHTKVASLEETRRAEVNMDSTPLASNEEEVSFEQFLRRRGEPDSTHSDASEQGSIHLEPLTPSEVLEHEATEILQQKGGVPASAKKTGLGSEPADLSSGGGSPNQEDLSSNQEEANNETS
ncbi:zinc finger protein 280D isoform X1 [Ahaetulla prasina]|nr:zinc finger protein 280D isoform X1 [Ahaetulla prasina]XP_058012548.1 zinc finger protein 280D isoform X1 [Ahaetulla prasina]XP_058012549.1 zinc finger protein 280D isoform X1 [Ahaetulla prasina]